VSGADNTPRADWAIRFVDVCKSFGDRNKRHTVLDRVSFSVPSGRTTVIAGGSGQGKSVILKLILGLLRPDSGQVLVGDRDIAALDYDELQETRMKFGVLFQGSALFDSLNVFENIALPLR
jgi:phospholipid/cholesterol/gamma-HCH transport system ATP-binding protein